MKISGNSKLLPFPPDKAYDLMQDPAVLGKTIPGCDSLERTGDNEYTLKLKMVLASLSGAFEGKVRLADPNRPTSFRMIVEGNGKIGFLKGDGVLTLKPVEQGTEVSYEGDVQIGGKMAAVGNRLVDTSARLLAKRFFDKLAEEEV